MKVEIEKKNNYLLISILLDFLISFGIIFPNVFLSFLYNFIFFIQFRTQLSYNILKSFFFIIYLHIYSTVHCEICVSEISWEIHEFELLFTIRCNFTVLRNVFINYLFNCVFYPNTLIKTQELKYNIYRQKKRLYFISWIEKQYTFVLLR